MTNTVLKKAIFISFLGHITVFSIFSFSFGKIIHKADYTSVYFWGQFLLNSQVNKPLPSVFQGHKNKFLQSEPDTSALDKVRRVSPFVYGYHLKPASTLSYNTEKGLFFNKPTPVLFSLKRREPMIILHPLLPYGFTLYFKDRQVAHVELMFNIVSAEGRNSVVVKRKISSGNLEVDLLSMRYIGHYLFIKQARFTPNNWQTVKIDLSAKND